jgi:hypothetical protein
MITLTQIKDTYGLSRYIVMEAVNTGKLTAYKPNRRLLLFKPEDVEKFILSTKVEIQTK